MSQLASAREPIPPHGHRPRTAGRTLPRPRQHTEVEAGDRRRPSGATSTQITAFDAYTAPYDLHDKLSASVVAGVAAAPYTLDLPNRRIIVRYRTAGVGGNAFALATTAPEITMGGATPTGGDLGMLRITIDTPPGEVTTGLPYLATNDREAIIDLTGDGGEATNDMAVPTRISDTMFDLQDTQHDPALTCTTAGAKPVVDFALRTNAMLDLQGLRQQRDRKFDSGRPQIGGRFTQASPRSARCRPYSYSGRM